jgi:hypothetical protein
VLTAIDVFGNHVLTEPFIFESIVSDAAVHDEWAWSAADEAAHLAPRAQHASPRCAANTVSRNPPS